MTPEEAARADWEAHPNNAGKSWVEANAQAEKNRAASAERAKAQAAKVAANLSPQYNQVLGGSGSGGARGVGGTAAVGGGVRLPAGGGTNSILAALGLGGPQGGGGGGGGGNTLGAGRPVAAYSPPPQAAQMTAQQNPYIKQLMALSLGQFNKPLDFNAERAKTREEQSLAMNEARQMAGRGGGQGQWGAQQQALAQAQQRALTGQEAGFADRETQARRALLGTMSGIGGEGTRDIASQLAAQQAQADLMQRYTASAQDYDIRRQQVADQGLTSRMSAITSLFGLI